jgi:hypothetical protein
MEMSLIELQRIAHVALMSLTTVEYPDIRLEQAEYKKDEKSWDIVASYLVANTNKRTLPMAISAPEFPFFRIYKRMKLNDKNEVVGFYIYDIKA